MPSIRDSLALLRNAFEDLSKDASRYTDNDIEAVQNLLCDLNILHERCLDARHVHPTLRISQPDYADILTDAVKQAHRDRN